MALIVIRTGGEYMIEVHKEGCRDLSQPKYAMRQEMGKAEDAKAFWAEYGDTGDDTNPGYFDDEVKFFPCCPTTAAGPNAS